MASSAPVTSEASESSSPVESSPASSEDRHPLLAGLEEGGFSAEEGAEAGGISGEDSAEESSVGGGSSEALESSGELSDGPDFVSQLGEYGFSDVSDELEGRRRLLESWEQQRGRLEELERRESQLSQLADYGREYLEQLRGGGGVSPQAESASEPESSRSSGSSWWSPPTFDQSWLERWRERDPASGEYRWREGTPANVRAQTEEYQSYLEDWADGLSRRPDEVLPPVIEQIAGALFERMYSERSAEESERRFFDRIREENSWMYELDPRTQQRTDNFSADGRRMAELLQEAADTGLTQSEQQWRYAHRLFELERGSQGAQGGQSSSESSQSIAARVTAEKRRQEHLRKASHQSDRGGSVPAREDREQGSTTRNINNTRGQDLLQELEAAGFGT